MARFHDEAAAEEAIRYWNETIRGGQMPDDIPLKEIAAPAEGVRIGVLLKLAGLAPSTSEAMRKLAQRAVRVDGEVVEDRDLSFQPGAEFVLQMGKRQFAKVKIGAE